MSIEAALYSRTTNDSVIAALIGDRCYPHFIPEGVSGAAVTYQQISATEVYTCEGGCGLVDTRFQLTAWSAWADAGGSHDECLELVAALVTRWKHFRGTVGDVVIQGTMIVDRGDVEQIDDRTEGAHRWGKYLDLIISYNE